MCRSDTSETKALQKRAFPPLPYGFSSALLFPTPSPQLSPLLQFDFISWLVSCIEYCFVPFTAAPLICGLAFTYRVSAVSFA